MAYSDDSVKAKLSSLNETQDSIVTLAQWIMFHRRHADRTAHLWLARLQESTTAKRLNLIYLANEVVQQSRARGKTDFLLAFEPLVAEATASAYKGASVEVQGKIKRVIEVWRQRQIFDTKIQEATEGRIEEIDRARGGGRANGTGGLGKLGGSLFGGSGGSVTAELESVSKALTTVTKAEIAAKSGTETADTEYARMMDANAPLPTPPVHAARLSALMKNLASAQGAVEKCIKARRELIEGLDKLVQAHKGKLAEDESRGNGLKSRRDGTEEKKKEVEDGIMQGLSTPEISTPPAGSGISLPVNGTEGASEPIRPEPESFTPPPPDVEAFTPPPQSAENAIVEDSFIAGENTASESLLADPSGAETIQGISTALYDSAPSFEPPTALQLPQVRQASGDFPGSTAEDPRLKRRKMIHPASSSNVEDDMFGSGVVGMDEEGVSALLGNE